MYGRIFYPVLKPGLRVAKNVLHAKRLFLSVKNLERFPRCVKQKKSLATNVFAACKPGFIVA